MQATDRTKSRHPEFGAKLKSARLRAGKSQERIAAEVGTSRRHWIRWERGEHIPSSEFLARIGEATGQPEEFVAEEDDEEPQVPREIFGGLIDAVRHIVREELSGMQRQDVA